MSDPSKNDPPQMETLFDVWRRVNWHDIQRSGWDTQDAILRLCKAAFEKGFDEGYNTGYIDRECEINDAK